MKFVLLFFTVVSFLLLVASCGGNDDSNGEGDPSRDSIVENSEFDYDTLKGLFKGDFGDSPISVNLSFVTEKHATGFNIVKGKRRNISGTVSQKGDKVILVLSEPGDDKTDGVFTLTMSAGDLSKITGEWQSQTGEVKSISLNRMVDDMEDETDRFASYPTRYNDSIGDLMFEPDGSCTYEFYEHQGEPTEQLVQVKGSWKKTGEQVAVFWQPNKVFSNRKSVFAIVKESGEETDVYYPKTLKGENREFSEIMY